MDEETARLRLKAFLGLAGLAAAMALLVLISAGTLRYLEGWVFLLGFLRLVAGHHAPRLTLPWIALRCLTYPARFPMFYDKWVRIYGKVDEWTEEMRFLDGTTARDRRR